MKVVFIFHKSIVNKVVFKNLIFLPIFDLQLARLGSTSEVCLHHVVGSCEVALSSALASGLHNVFNTRTDIHWNFGRALELFYLAFIF